MLASDVAPPSSLDTFRKSRTRQRNESLGVSAWRQNYRVRNKDLGVKSGSPRVERSLDASSVSHEQKHQRAKSKTVVQRTWFGALCLALGLAFVLARERIVVACRSLLLEEILISSGSMIPSLMIGDHAYIEGALGIIHRGDLVAFHSLKHPGQTSVKRVIGLPGDILQLVGGHIVLNGVTIPTCLVGAAEIGDGQRTFDGDVVIEVLDRNPYLVFYDRHPHDVSPTDMSWAVEAGELFAIGDNRFHSYDSAAWWHGQGAMIAIGNVRPVRLAQQTSISLMGRPSDRRGLDGLRLPPGLAGLSAELERCARELQID